VVHGGGSTLVWQGGGGRADEHQWATGKLTSWSVGAKEGRTGELHGEVGVAAVCRVGGFDSRRGRARRQWGMGLGARGHRALPIGGSNRGWGWPEGAAPRELGGVVAMACDSGVLASGEAAQRCSEAAQRSAGPRESAARSGSQRCSAWAWGDLQRRQRQSRGAAAWCSARCCSGHGVAQGRFSRERLGRARGEVAELRGEANRL
jgi:hypothetical protein